MYAVFFSASTVAFYSLRWHTNIATLDVSDHCLRFSLHIYDIVLIIYIYF